MKAIFFAAAICFTMQVDAQTRGVVDSRTKTFTLTGNLNDDYTIIGYSAPSLKAEKAILFSVFTNQVKDNPGKYPLGAYYETGGLKEGDKILYDSESKKFVKLNYVDANNNVTPFYVRRGFVRIE